MIKVLKFWHLLLLLFAFILLLTFYYFFFSVVGVSMNVTGNGIWKAVGLRKYSLGIAGIEMGNVLYFPILNFFANIFNCRTGYDYYKLIVLFNGFCSSVLHIVLYSFFVWRLGSYSRAFIITLVHFLLVGVFSLSYCNEDIFPSYSFFVLGVLCFYVFIVENRYGFLFFTLISFSFSTLFHWTSGVPVFISLFLFCVLHFRKYDISEKKLIFLKLFFVPALVFGCVSIFYNLNLFNMLLPSKSGGSLWVSGFLIEKIPLVILNTCSFLEGGVVVRQLDNVFNFFWVIAFFGLVLVVLSIYLHFFKLKKLCLEWYYVACFLSIHFFWATLMNYYEQGSDPQFFLLPQFYFYWILVAIFLFKPIFNYRWIVLFCLSFSLLINSLGISFNYKKDQKYFNDVNIVYSNILDPNKTLFIVAGFELFNGLAQLKIEANQSFYFIRFPEANLSELKFDSVQYRKNAIDTFNYYHQKGFEFVCVDFINQDPVFLGKSFIGFDLTPQISGVQQYLKDSFDISELPQCFHHKFYKLKPKF